MDLLGNSNAVARGQGLLVGSVPGVVSAERVRWGYFLTGSSDSLSLSLSLIID